MGEPRMTLEGRLVPTLNLNYTGVPQGTRSMKRRSAGRQGGPRRQLRRSSCGGNRGEQRRSGWWQWVGEEGEKRVKSRRWASLPEAALLEGPPSPGARVPSHCSHSLPPPALPPCPCLSARPPRPQNLPHAPCQKFYIAHLHNQPWVQVGSDPGIPALDPLPGAHAACPLGHKPWEPQHAREQGRGHWEVVRDQGCLRRVSHPLLPLACAPSRCSDLLVATLA